MDMKKYFTLFLGTIAALFSPIEAQETNPTSQTLSIIKPDAVAANHIGEIIERFEKANLKVVAAKMTRLTKSEAEKFYAVHRARPFFKDLVTYMTSGPIFVQVLQGVDAVAKNRELMGATDPKKADPGTIRADFGTDIQFNAVHGSDSAESAKSEIAFFFKPSEIFSRYTARD
jgi:nucleoside-diphosphate kinase